MSGVGWKPRLRLAPRGEYARVARVLSGLGVHTVCEEALCPNIGECWGEGTATFLILGDTCTRGCRFCYVKRGWPGTLDPSEPYRVAEAVARLGLRYVTITSVDRDDLPDYGAGQYAAVVREVKRRVPGVIVEALTPDFQGDPSLVRLVAESGLEVYAHNIETVERLTPQVRDPRAGYRQSLEVLRVAKEAEPCLLTKSSILLGLGEEIDEVVEAMRDLRSVGVDILVLSQYLRPSPKQLPVAKIYRKSEYDYLARRARELGFLAVHAHPLARTSHRAYQLYQEAIRKRRGCG